MPWYNLNHMGRKNLLNEDNYIPYIYVADVNGYYGIRIPDNGQQGWLRTPRDGLLPYMEGDMWNGHSSLGTAGWAFREAYISNIYTGRVTCPVSTGTYLAGAKEDAAVAINMTAPSGYNMLARIKGSGGVFNIGVVGAALKCFYISDDKINNNENGYNSQVTLLDTTGSSSIGGTFAAEEFVVKPGSGCIIYAGNEGDGYYSLHLGCGYQGRVKRSVMVSANSTYPDGAFYPAGDNSMILGLPGLRWRQVYATNSTISTSDRNLKKDISYIGQESQHKDTYMSDTQLVKFMMGLLPCIFKRTDGESGRPHHGIISQDFEKLLKDVGLHDHAAFIKSPKMVEIEEETEKEVPKEVLQEDETVKIITEKIKEKIVRQEVVPGEYIYGIRYEELEGDIIRFCQIIYNRLETLEETAKGQQKKITALEDALKTQEEKTKGLEERLKKFEEMFKTCTDNSTTKSRPEVVLY